MGFIGHIFKTIFSPDIPQAAPMAPTNTLTGRDLVKSTASVEADSPEMGTDVKKKGGLSTLLVPSEKLYKGGV